MKTNPEEKYTPLNILDLYVASCRECGCDDVNISFDDIAVRAVNSHEALLTLFRRGLECGVFDDAPVYKADVAKVVAQAEGKAS